LHDGTAAGFDGAINWLHTTILIHPVLGNASFLSFWKPSDEPGSGPFYLKVSAARARAGPMAKVYPSDNA
jgi:hypothetical protein